MIFSSLKISKMCIHFFTFFRLCEANQNGTFCREGANQGFVEIFNKTTMQWVPMCDTRFSERNAEVVCRQLGFSNLNVYLDFGQRIEYRADSLSRIIYWPEPYQCTGLFTLILVHLDYLFNCLFTFFFIYRKRKKTSSL